MDAKLIEIPVDLIDPDPKQARQWFDEDKLRALGQSMVALGQDVPVGVIPSERDSSGNVLRYLLMDGERRWRAAKMVGLPTVLCILRDHEETPGTPGGLLRHRERQRASAIHKEPLNLIEDANSLHEIIELRRAQNPDLGVTEIKKAIAREEDVSVDAVYGRLLFHSLSPQVAEAVVASKVLLYRLRPHVTAYRDAVDQVLASKRGKDALRAVHLICKSREIHGMELTPGFLEPLLDSAALKSALEAVYPDPVERARQLQGLKDFRKDLEREAKKVVQRIRGEKRTSKGSGRRKPAPESQEAPAVDAEVSLADPSAPSAAVQKEASGGGPPAPPQPVVMRQAKSGSLTIFPDNLEKCAPEERERLRIHLVALLARLDHSASGRDTAGG